MNSICNQILDLLIKGLPYTDCEIGVKVQALDFTLSVLPNKVNLVLEPDKYNDFVSKYINVQQKNIFTISGIYLKNNIILFENYILDLFTIKFEKPHYKKINTQIVLEGFANTIYNGAYQVTKVIDDYKIVVTKNDIPQTNLTTGLGYTSIQYTGGLNMVTELIDEGNNTLSYTFNEQYFAPINIDDIDTNKKPYIHYLLDSVLCFDKNQLLETNVESKIFLLIDTSSLVFSPHRSNTNKTDANYSTMGATSQFQRNVNLNIYYIIDGPTNSSNIDIELIKMDRALNFILRRSLENNDGYSSTLSIGTALKDNNSIQDGRTIFEYGVEFYISYVVNDNVLQFLDEIYPIERVQVNNDLVIFT